MDEHVGYNDDERAFVRGRVTRVHARTQPAGRTVWACVCGLPFESAVLRGHHTPHCKIKKAIAAWEVEQLLDSIGRARAKSSDTPP